MDMTSDLQHDCPLWLESKPKKNKQRYKKKKEYVEKMQERKRRFDDAKAFLEENLHFRSVQEEESHNPLSPMQERKGRFDDAKAFLEEHLHFRSVQEEESDHPLSERIYEAKTCLEKNLSFKKILAFGTLKGKECHQRTLDKCSKNLVALLREGLPKSGLAWDRNDGSISLDDAASLTNWPVDTILQAVTPPPKQKIRLVVYEKIGERAERRIAALGGHFFVVRNPISCFEVCHERAIQMRELVHETPSAKEISSSGFISAMGRPGGVNFSIGSEERVEWRKMAPYEILVDVVTAVDQRVIFMENRISGVVFGLGKFDLVSGWYDGKIPYKFCSTRKKQKSVPK